MAPRRIQKVGPVMVGAWMMRDAGGMLGVRGGLIESKRPSGLIGCWHAWSMSYMMDLLQDRHRHLVTTRVFVHGGRKWRCREPVSPCDRCRDELYHLMSPRFL